jgi:hypothetical protein
MKGGTETKLDLERLEQVLPELEVSATGDDPQVIH